MCDVNVCQVTCQRQPALGGVFKLVSLAGQPRMKLSQDVEKMTLPGEKAAFRLFGRSGLAILDLLQLPDESEPVVGQKVDSQILRVLFFFQIF